jgi:hypothetical protein
MVGQNMAQRALSILNFIFAMAFLMIIPLVLSGVCLRAVVYHALANESTQNSTLPETAIINLAITLCVDMAPCLCLTRKECITRLKSALLTKPPASNLHTTCT